MLNTLENQSSNNFVPSAQTYPSVAIFDPLTICKGIRFFREKTHVLYDDNLKRIGIQIGKEASSETEIDYRILASLSGIYPEWLGDRSFLETHSVRFPYICGEMANGIASTKMVIRAAQVGLMSFFGAAGLSVDRVRSEIQTIQSALGNSLSWGINLIHSPNERGLEQKFVDLYLEKDVRRISASAFMGLSPSIVQFACTGLHEKNGRSVRSRFVFAKISRLETAKHFMSPPPNALLEELVKQGKLTKKEAQIASTLPLSEDITVEADSGGHTDNQVLPSIFPAIMELRNRLQKEYKFSTPIRIGAAGGIGTPSGAASAFAMGAAYILTGSINQSCEEADLDPLAKKALADAKFGDTMMCAAADMFEQGVKLQVLKRGTMYGIRANWLYEIYKNNHSLETLPTSIVERLEKEIFKLSLKDVWEETKNFWLKRDSNQIRLAETDSKHKMALVFRYYLGLSSKWAIQGQRDRIMDYQIWCGPAQASFNEWVRGTFLEQLENRNVVQVALNILEGACQIQRANQLRSLGVPVPMEAFHYNPSKLSIKEFTTEELNHVH